MVQKYASLQKKLQEIESKLDELVRYNQDHNVHCNHSWPTTEEEDPENLEEKRDSFNLHCEELIRMEADFRRKDAFLQRVLMAEIESHHSTDDSDSEERLHHFADRLKACEEEYAMFVQMRKTVTKDEEGEGEEDGDVDDDDHHIIPCHCTHACFEKEDGVQDNVSSMTASVDVDEKEEQPPSQPLFTTDATVTDRFSDDEEEEKICKKRKKRSVWPGNMCIAIFFAVVTAIGVAVINSIGYVDDDILVPT
ncbi:hypothetical protein ZOSMA_85G00710 [Zostera marina]|uniref:DUF7610 domain-containing protein n=1 Tax=Zostera marina TaxID=29655 RepID=A0A0K9NL51_ZOSMR|nr:hypothetical protein ZOSMA_85G00710 [Zostera marina]